MILLLHLKTPYEVFFPTSVTVLHLTLECAILESAGWNLFVSKQCSTFAPDMRIAMRLALPSCLDSPFSFFGGIRGEIGRRWAGEAPQK